MCLYPNMDVTASFLSHHRELMIFNDQTIVLMYIQNMFKWAFDISILVVQFSLYRWANRLFVLPLTRIIEKSAPSLGTIIPFSGQQLFEMTN